MTRAVAHVMTPTNLIAALCAFQTHRKQGKTKSKLVVLLENGHAPDDVTLAAANVLKAMVRELEFVDKLLVLTIADRAKMGLQSNGRLAEQEVISFVGSPNIDTIFYPHDLSSDIVPSLLDAYPNSRLICTGDGFGQVLLRNDHLQFLGIEPEEEQQERGVLSRVVDRLRSLPIVGGSRRRRRKAGSLLPDQCALVLPVDHSGGIADQIPLTVCPREVVGDTIDAVIRSCRALTSYLEEISKSYPSSSCALLLPDNFHDAGIISEQNEIAFLAEAIRRHCAPGSGVLIKPHPNGRFRHAPHLQAALGGAFAIHEVNADWQRYPIELWRDFLKSRTVIAPGHAALTLKYLYDVDVAQPLDESSIRLYFPEQYRAFLVHAVDLTMAPLERLSEWDRKTYLYKGYKMNPAA